jgi:hypothetical protein
LTRTKASDEAGLSERQRKTAIAIAGIAAAEFDRLIEATPTTTAAMSSSFRQSPSMAGIGAAAVAAAGTHRDRKDHFSRAWSHGSRRFDGAPVSGRYIRRDIPD